MGNTLTMEAVKSVRFLRNTCANGSGTKDASPSEPTSLIAVLSSPEPPPSGMIRNSVVRKALRRPSRGVRKAQSVSLDWDDQDTAMLLDKVC